MKILLTIDDISTFGGAERVVVNLANALVEQGHKVEILSFFKTNENLPYNIDKDIRVHFWKYCSQFIFEGIFFSTFIRKNYMFIFINIYVYFKFKNFDVIIANDQIYRLFFKHKPTRYIRCIHTIFTKYHKRNNFFDTLVLLSNKEHDIYQVHHKNIKVIPNFLPSIHIKNTNTTQKRIISVGRMQKDDVKGFLRLIDIWALLQQSLQSSVPPPQLHSWQLVIVGDGDMKNEIETKIKDLGLQDSIILKPFTKDIESEYLNASIYAMSSYYEGFPMVLLESCSYGLCPISFDIKTGPSDIIENNTSGYLIQDNDLHTYAHKLIELMSDENKRKTMGEAAKARVAQKFSKEAIMPLWEEVLKEGKEF
ncbi:glycosyltransferase family 4 protein [Helicobacter typhlonius]|uniref:glycosyltransferase family 4 protein n=1 Tax=Helicobacter typhlonius TaxID=76936 RepID=UPI002FE172DE